MLEIYWVDRWDLRTEEMAGMAIKLTTCRPGEARQVMEVRRRKAFVIHGGGELVGLDEQGCRRAGPVPVDPLAVTAGTAI